MGKTKTAFVTGVAEEAKTSAERYKEKKEKQALREAQGKQKKVHIAGLKGGQRVKMVEAEVVPTEEPQAASPTSHKATRAPRLRGKKYLQSKTKIDRHKTYSLPEAIKLVKETSYSKFDGTIELHLVVKKTGFSANVTLPHPAGKEKKVEIASDATIKKLAAGKIDFDVLLATPEMMPKLVPFAKVLGPKGLMPNPKNGTLITDPKKIKDFSAASTVIKTEKEVPLIHTVIGKVSQTEKELIANFEAIIKAISEKQIVKAYLKATMGPSIKLTIS